ncbi:zinc finger CCCH domain-containing protein 13-like [Mya arenaria]|uniref:zinc finger CCCH domain-containing protein 13-like n=1 Tax=Mya arenaria TaxID=6604 RepID=UPI0022E8A3D0|nr:zinc finger CCCH domain-containing protein 13-like [Mya arenaria]
MSDQKDKTYPKHIETEKQEQRKDYFELLEFPKSAQPTPDQKASADTKQNIDEGSHREEDYETVEAPKSTNRKSDQKSNPDSKQNKDESKKKQHKEEDNVTVEIHKPTKFEPGAVGSMTNYIDSGHANPVRMNYEQVTFETKYSKDKTESRAEELYDVPFAIPYSTTTKLDQKTKPYPKHIKNEKRGQGKENYEQFELPISNQPKPDINEPAKPKTDGLAGLEHIKKDYVAVASSNATKNDHDQTTNADTKQNKDKSEKRPHREEDYVTVEIPKSTKSNPDQKTNPDSKQNDYQLEKKSHREEDYVTVVIPKSTKPKPDQTTNPDTKQTKDDSEKKSHMEEDYETVEIPKSKSKPDNERQERQDTTLEKMLEDTDDVSTATITTVP